MHYVRNIAVLLLTCLFVGCSQKSQAPETETDGSLEQEALSLGEASQFVSDKQIAVVFGHSYNDERFVSETRAQIASRFGLASEGGLVLPLIFPDDFKNGRIAPLDDMLADYDICGLIVIGAPERTYAVLARLQDSWGAEAPAYPVIMLAPQDDVLGIEAGADLVLDFAAGNETDTLEEQVAEPSDEMPELLFALIRYMYLLKDEFDSVLSNVRGDVLDLLGDSWEITPYIDSETGLYAINHFIIERKKLSNE